MIAVWVVSAAVGYMLLGGVAWRVQEAYAVDEAVAIPMSIFWPLWVVLAVVLVPAWLGITTTDKVIKLFKEHAAAKALPAARVITK